MAREDEDRAAQEARAERLRSKIGRITSGEPDGPEPADAGDAPTNEAGGAGGRRPGTGLDEQSWAGTSENPRDFIHRKMREGEEEGRKEE